MYKIDKKYRNLNRKTYINSNFEHLLASNFTESLFLKFILGRFFSKISEKKCCFLVIIRRSGINRSRMQEQRERNKGSARRRLSLLALTGQEVLL